MGKNLKPFTIFHALYYSVKPYSQLGSSKHNLISVSCSVAYVGEQNKWFVLEMITTFRQETPCVPSTRKEVIVYASMGWITDSTHSTLHDKYPWFSHSCSRFIELWEAPRTKYMFIRIRNHDRFISAQNRATSTFYKKIINIIFFFFLGNGSWAYSTKTRTV